MLLGLQRIVPFVGGPRQEWISQQTQEHLKTVGTDIVSLTDYELHLANKVQFLLDAVLGLINTKQNDIFTVLTVVSVVGIPPTLVASIYGMNFKNMPELTWMYGYQSGTWADCAQHHRADPVVQMARVALNNIAVEGG